MFVAIVAIIARFKSLQISTCDFNKITKTLLKLILRDLIPVRSRSLACNSANQFLPFLEASKYSSSCSLKPVLNNPPSLTEIGGSSTKLSSNSSKRSSNGSSSLN